MAGFIHSAPFWNLLRTLRRRAMRKGRSIQSKIHEYQKLRNYVLSGYMPGRVCEATDKDVVMITCIPTTPHFYSFRKADLVFGDFDYV